VSIRILFVDDEPFLLAGIKSMLRKYRTQWEMEFASSAQAALDAMGVAPFDVVVSDMRMPVTDGAALLAEVRKRSPRTARIILSGQADRASTLRALPVTHQFLSKPCEPGLLCGTIERVLAVQRLVHDDEVRALIGRIDRLPPMPRSALKLQAACQRGAAMPEIAAIVEDDPGLAAKALQLVSSAFFGYARRVTTVKQAVSLLGTEILTALSLESAVAPAKGGPFSDDELAALHESSTATARVARAIVADPQKGGEAFSAGLLAKTGYLALGLVQPARVEAVVARARAESVPLDDAERGLGGATHAQVGALLLGTWGVPFDLVEAVLFHADPSAAEPATKNPALVAVHIAHAVVRAAFLGTDATDVVDHAFLARAGVTDGAEHLINKARVELATLASERVAAHAA
jgi:HD-like signal output (HDOD) protein